MYKWPMGTDRLRRGCQVILINHQVHPCMNKPVLKKSYEKPEKDSIDMNIESILMDSGMGHSPTPGEVI